MNRLRFRLRSAMIVVALVAIALGCRRAYQLASISANHALMAKSLRSMASGFRVQAAAPNTSPEIAADFLEQAEEMEEVARVYEQAANRPWARVTFKVHE